MQRDLLDGVGGDIYFVEKTNSIGKIQRILTTELIHGSIVIKKQTVLEIRRTVKILTGHAWYTGHCSESIEFLVAR